MILSMQSLIELFPKASQGLAQAGARITRHFPPLPGLKYLPVRTYPPLLLPVCSRPAATQSGGSERLKYPSLYPEDEYHQFKKDRDLALKRLLESPNRFQQIGEREDRSDTPGAAFRASFDGKYFTIYRGFDVMKGCHDMIIYMQFFWYIKPATIIEIGACSGGTAVWMADMLKLMDVECNIYSMDIDLSLIEDRVKKLQPHNIKFVHGDCYKVEEAFSPEFLHSLPHPLVIIEDAHANFPDILKYFHKYMKPGDYFIVDDTTPYTPTATGVGKIHSNYEGWGPEKLTRLRKFLSEHNKYYAVDSFFTDYFGYNGTSNWNGYIRRMC